MSRKKHNAKQMGSKYWAHSFVILKNSGLKIYLEEFLNELEDQLNSSSNTITVEISNLFETMTLKKECIAAYGKVL